MLNLPCISLETTEALCGMPGHDENEDDKQSEKQLQSGEENKKDNSGQTSNERSSGAGDLKKATSASSFPPKVVMPVKPEYLQSGTLKAEGDLQANTMDNSLFTDKCSFSKTITGEGGTVAGEGVKLECPPGAVDDTVSVNITLEDPSKYYGLMFQKDLENDVMFGAPVVNLRPNGHVFKKPVTLTISLKTKKFQCDDVLILHGTEAGDGKINWQDVTQNSMIDETNKEVIIEMGHFSIIFTLFKLTLIRAKDIVSRLNLLGFDYAISILLNKNTMSEELALLFVSKDVYTEQFYKEDDTSALAELKSQGFRELHVRSIDGEEEKRIYNSESLQVSVRLGEDYSLADSRQESTALVVRSYVWWNVGEVVKIPLKWTTDVRIMCGTIMVQGEFGHTSERRFCEGDVCGYMRSLLDVERAVFNLTPIAQLLKMPDELIDQIMKESWKDEDEQLERILKYWLEENGVEKDLATLKKKLGGLKKEDYEVTERGQIHIRSLREIAVKILLCKNSDALRELSRKTQILLNRVLRDCCIELDDSIESDEINHIDFLEHREQIPKDSASKYQQICSSSEESTTETFLAIVPYLIQNIKKIFVDRRSLEVQNGLRGLPEETLKKSVANIRNAEKNNGFRELVDEVCAILDLLCQENRYIDPSAWNPSWGKHLAMLSMLNFLKRLFQYRRQDQRLYKRLLFLFSGCLRDINSNRVDGVLMRDFCNVSLGLLNFAKFDPSKMVTFALTDSRNCPVPCRSENVKCNGDIFSQRFHVRREMDEELRLHAIARVHVDGRICEKGAFQSVIMLNASCEEAFNRCMNHFVDVSVIKLKVRDSENLRVVLNSNQKTKISEVLEVLRRELSEELVDLRQSEVTQCHLTMRHVATEAREFLSLRLIYQWGSDAVGLDSKDFETFPHSSTGGACKPEVYLVGEGDPPTAEAAALSLPSIDENFALGIFDQLQKHEKIPCGKIECHWHQHVNYVKGEVCVVGDKTTLNNPTPSQRALEEGPCSAPNRSITDGEKLQLPAPSEYRS